MSGAIAQLSSGLNPDSESTVRACPDVPGWTENLLFTPYDPVSDIGMWLHLGTVADMWEMWEDRVLIALPEDQGVLSMWAYHRTVPDRQPAGANLEFHCERPFQKWRITFDGFCVRSSYEEMRTGLLADGAKSHVRLDLEVECLTPVWDAASAGDGMSEQSWAREHYEQLTRVTGQLTVDGVTTDFNGGGWRDHSRGPRGADTLKDWGGHVITGGVLPSGRAFGMCRYWAREHYEQLTRVTGQLTVDGVTTEFNGGGWRDHSRGPRGADTLKDWGGHVITGGVLPSGRAFGMCRYWARDGRTTLEGGYVVEDGTLHQVSIVAAPPPAVLARDGETYSFALDGSHTMNGTVRSSLWISMADGLPYGVMDPVRAYTVSWAEVQWDGEIGHAYIERSALTGARAR